MLLWAVWNCVPILRLVMCAHAWQWLVAVSEALFCANTLYATNHQVLDVAMTKLSEIYKVAKEAVFKSESHPTHPPATHHDLI